MLHGLGAGALADAGERNRALVAAERRGADLDQLVRAEGAVDFGDHGVGKASFTKLKNRIEIMGARFERLAIGWDHVFSG